MVKKSDDLLHPLDDQAAWTQLKSAVREKARGEILRRFEHVGATVKADGSLLTEADTGMQRAMQAFLHQHWPRFDFLGEESSPEKQAAAIQSASGCWILDPLDGTSNFASGIPVFAVSLALVVGGQTVAGLVYDPLRDELFAARRGRGAELNDRRLVAATPKRRLAECIAIVDFKRLDRVLASALVEHPPYASQRSFGSVALDWCWVAAGRGQVYCHGAQNIWDYAAGQLILDEAGGVSASFNGDPVFSCNVEKRSAIAATTPALFEQWQTWFRQAGD